MQPGETGFQITKISVDEDDIDWDDYKKIASFDRKNEIEAKSNISSPTSTRMAKVIKIKTSKRRK